MSAGDTVFAGTVPQVYDGYLVPLIFEAYACDVAESVRALHPSDVLEVACGSGVATRAMANALPEDSRILATDLNQAMLDHAAGVGTSRPVEWRLVDAMSLPFDDDSFDAVVCQFGAMFFPDKPKAFSEARRVLKPGGTYIMNVWDRISENEFADTVTRSLETVFPTDPPRFMERTPHGYHDVGTVDRDMRTAGFVNPAIETIAKRSRAESARIPAIAYCQGTPLKDEIVARDASRLAEATDVAEKAVAARFGSGPVDAKIQAHIVVAKKE